MVAAKGKETLKNALSVLIHPLGTAQPNRSRAFPLVAEFGLSEM